MAVHINRIRGVNQTQRMSARDVITPNATNLSFGAFCGTKIQRDTIGYYEMGRCCGRKGVVLVHNDPMLESRLGQIYALYPQLARNSGNFQMFLANQNGSRNSYYDPLYGLGQTGVLNAVAPMPADARYASETLTLRSVLTDYLEIMDYQFRRNPALFGDYPYNLELLLDLTGMPYPELERRVLQFLPGSMASSLRGRLSGEGVQQRAFYAVRAFSQQLGQSLWTPRGVAGHSRLSIVQAVRSGNLISVYVPGSRGEILDYLAVELQSLNDSNTPYLLVASGITLNNSPDFKALFLADHDALPYSTGILAEDLSGVVSREEGDQELMSLFSQSQELFVFACSSVLAATPFSSAIGHYYREVHETHDDTRREPLRILASHGRAHIRRETQQLSVDPEELRDLAAGCLLCGKNYPIPMLVDHFAI